jgi:hypothetical protein
MGIIYYLLSTTKINYLVFRHRILIIMPTRFPVFRDVIIMLLLTGVIDSRISGLFKASFNFISLPLVLFIFVINLPYKISNLYFYTLFMSCL